MPRSFLINLFVVVDKIGSASTSNSACCGCFQRRNRETLLEMYRVGVLCNDHRKCSERTRLGPSDSDCLLSEKLHKKGPKNDKDLQGNTNYPEYEFADDAINLDTKNTNSHSTSFSKRLVTQYECNPYINVNGKEELPCIHKYYFKDTSPKKEIDTISKSPEYFPILHNNKNLLNKDQINKNLNGNSNRLTIKNVYGYCTLPKNKKKHRDSKYLLKHIVPPKRITPDGTHIYYWCDLQKKENCGKCLLQTFKFNSLFITILLLL